MPVEPGTRLGDRYEVRSKLGEGGMGVVYRGVDPKLDREVAIKVLPPDYSADAERLARFELEARTAGALSHENVLTVYDTGTHGAEPYIVSELLEGEELRAKLAGGALPLRRALDYARQIAHGLAAAHARGIVHRDLKPENVFVTAEGRAKILDFGVAKLVESAPRNGDQTGVETRRMETRPGALIGTPNYMSPEQAAGAAVDHRSDIFSFGCVLYEMLAGRRAFERGDWLDTLSAIRHDDPPAFDEANGRPAVPEPVERIVMRCLEKQPARRFQSAGDLAFALETLSGRSGSTAATLAAPAPAPARFSRERLIWIGVSSLLLAATAALAYAFFSRPRDAPRTERLSLATPGGVTAVERVTVSPDGRRVVFIATGGDGKRLLWLRSLDSLVAQPLAGTERAVHPFWSPDGRFVGYFAGGKLYKVDAAGGRPQALCDASGDGGGAWSTSGAILFNGGGGLWRVPAEGGAPAQVTKLGPNEEAHRWPYFLPDGRHFVFLADAERTEDHYFRLGSLDSQDTQVLFNAISRVAYAPPGYLLYVRQGVLVARPFDAGGLRVTGEPVPIAEQVAEVGVNHEFDFSVSETGVLAYQWGTRDSRLTWVDRAGKGLGAVGEPANYDDVALSPDGRRASVSIPDADGRNPDVWLLDLARGTSSRLTFDPQADFGAVWSPDGSRLVFSSNRSPGGRVHLYEKAANGAGDDRLLWAADGEQYVTSWSPGGEFILFTYQPPQEYESVWVLPLSGGGQPRPLLQSAAFGQWNGKVSPGGRFVAYSSDETGRPEVYVQPFPASGDKWQVSTGGGMFPSWRADGRELFYVALDGSLMSVEIKSGTAFEGGVPRQLFLTNLKISNGFPYAPAPDGQRFLVNLRADAINSAPLTVILDWTAGLKR